MVQFPATTMVQFSLKLADNRVDKWSSYYLDYKSLKEAIAQIRRSRRADNSHEARRVSALSLQVGDATDCSTDSRPSEETKLFPVRQSPQRALIAEVLSPSSGAATPSSFEKQLRREIDKAIVCRGRGTATAMSRVVVTSTKESDLTTFFPFNSLHKRLDNEQEPDQGSKLSRFHVELREKVEAFFVRTVDDCKIELANLHRTLPTNQSTPGYRDGEQNGDALEGEAEGGNGSESQELWATRAIPPYSRFGKKEEESLKRALLALYRDLTLLKNFSIVNYTAVVKITKKYDKNLKHKAHELSSPWNPAGPLTPKILESVQQKTFFKADSLEEVISETEEFFADNFCGGDVAQAKGLMLPQKVDERIDAAQFQLGYYLGIAAVLMAWVVWDCLFEPDYNDPVFRNEWRASVFLQPAFPVYRGIAGILLLRWCWGMSTLIWGRARINYIYLFDMDPREVTIPLNVLNNVALEIIIVLANLLIYFKHLMNHFPLGQDFPAGLVPLFLCVFIVFKMMYPFGKAWEIWRTIFRVLATPFFKVNFFSTYVADVMTSSVKTTQDIAWAFCFFLSGDFLLSAEEYHVKGTSWQHSTWYVNVVIPALCALPLVLRFAQCVKRYGETRKRSPHLLNCLKYMMAFAVALFGVLVPSPYITANAVKTTWFVLYVISTIYTFFWDVVQDWGLGDRNYGFLRKKRLFSRSWVYYAAIVTDLILRFNWVYSLIPPHQDSLPFVRSSTLSVSLTTVVMVLEYLRRTMWGCFRVENEHLNNTEEYRSEKHVPLHFTTTTARPSAKPLQNGVVIKEVIIVTLVGIAVAAVAITAAKFQPEV